MEVANKRAERRRARERLAAGGRAGRKAEGERADSSTRAEPTSDKDTRCGVSTAKKKESAATAAREPPPAKTANSKREREKRGGRGQQRAWPKPSAASSHPDRVRPVSASAAHSRPLRRHLAAHAAPCAGRRPAGGARRAPLSSFGAKRGSTWCVFPSQASLARGATRAGAAQAARYVCIAAWVLAAGKRRRGGAERRRRLHVENEKEARGERGEEKKTAIGVPLSLSSSLSTALLLVPLCSAMQCRFSLSLPSLPFSLFTRPDGCCCA